MDRPKSKRLFVIGDEGLRMSDPTQEWVKGEIKRVLQQMADSMGLHTVWSAMGEGSETWTAEIVRDMRYLDLDILSAQGVSPLDSDGGLRVVDPYEFGLVNCDTLLVIRGNAGHGRIADLHTRGRQMHKQIVWINHYFRRVKWEGKRR